MTLPNNRVNVVFVINEGARTGVGSIIFVGNKAFTASRLTGVIQTRTTNWLSWLNKRDVYSEEKVQADQELLRRFYLQHGYADFQVLGADAQFDAARGKYVVTFTVDEGPKYKFGDVVVDSSINGVDGSTLTSFVRTKGGRVFNATEIEKSTEALTIELSRLGYVFAQVRPRGDRDYTNNIIAMTYVIDEGPRAYVERIDVRGNTKTRDYVIRPRGSISRKATPTIASSLIAPSAACATSASSRRCRFRPNQARRRTRSSWSSTSKTSRRDRSLCRPACRRPKA